MEPNPDAEEPTMPVAETHPEEPASLSVATDGETAPSVDHDPSDEATAPVADESGEPDNAGAPYEGDPLEVLATASQRGRLSPTDEEQAVTLTKEALLGGRAGVARATGALTQLPWVIGVTGVTNAWAEMKPIFRRQLLAGLARIDSEAARRIRLSLARGLFKQDVPTALKVAIGAVKEMRDKETGALAGRSGQMLASVFIGRAKPWIAQLPLADLKPAEADLLVHAALLTVFTLPHAPVTQLGVLKWASEAGRLAKLHPMALEAVTKGLSRWSPKWQIALRKETTDLPEEITAVLDRTPARDNRERAERPERSERPVRRDAEREEPAEEADEAEAAARPVGLAEGDSPVREERDDREDDDEDDDEKDDAAEAERPPAPRPRPVYESKTVPSQGQRQGRGQERQERAERQDRQQGSNFNLVDALRQIEAHVSSLRSELHTAQAKLRQRDDDTRRSSRRSDRPDRAAVPIIEGEPTPDELARLNRQLETRNAELQQRIQDLTADSEDRAASMGAHDGDQAPPPDAQLRTLLGLKLQEDHADFLALDEEAPDIVVQQHYRTVLRHVFEVLRQEGVTFAPPEAPAGS